MSFQTCSHEEEEKKAAAAQVGKIEQEYLDYRRFALSYEDGDDSDGEENSKAGDTDGYEG